jgi:hypothetical protein
LKYQNPKLKFGSRLFETFGLFVVCYCFELQISCFEFAPGVFVGLGASDQAFGCGYLTGLTLQALGPDASIRIIN